MKNSPLKTGFTAIELMIVLIIMATLATMAAPRVLDIMRNNAVTGTANEVLTLWQRAVSLAQQQQPDYNDETPNHYGILIKQDSGSPGYASLIFSNTLSPSMSDAVVVAGKKNRTDFNSNVLLSSVTGSADREFGNQTIVVYAQYGSGFPIAPAEVAAGRGSYASPTPLGVNAGLLSKIYSQPSSVRFQTLDFETDADGNPVKGVGFDMQIYGSGMQSVREVANNE